MSFQFPPDKAHKTLQNKMFDGGAATVSYIAGQEVLL